MLEVLYVVDLRTEMAEGLVAKYNQANCKVLHPDQQQTALTDNRFENLSEFTFVIHFASDRVFADWLHHEQDVARALTDEQ